MAGIRYFCCTDARRAALQAVPALNGIDFLEVDDLLPGDLDAAEAAEYASLPANERDRLLWQRKLTVQFVNPLLPAQTAVLAPVNLRLDGGERPDARHIGLAVLATEAQSIVLGAARSGDFSVYRLSVVTGPDDPDPPAVLDPLLSAVDFTFKVDCPTDFDCMPVEACPPDERPAIEIDYLTRDYSSFRRLMLDRISTLVPDWRERHAPDVGIALVELVAYAADYLSYRQEAVATEAYLGTARKRVSVRRHARLVDYPMHDGCNARVWVQVVLAPDAPEGVVLQRLDPGSGRPVRFLTRCAAGPVLNDAQLAQVLAGQRPEVFEPIADATLWPEHDEIGFYTWGADECCLPQGATRATLAGKLPHLAAGDVLIFEEVRGPKTGVPGDVDLAHRQAVRLTSVTAAVDPLGGRFAEPPTNDPADITEIEWSSADALTFPVCVSATIHGEDGKDVPAVISVARGNIVLADHGRTVSDPLAGRVPAPSIFRPVPAAPGCEAPDAVPVPPRYRPGVPRSPVTQAAPAPLAVDAASAATHQNVADAVPQIALAADPPDDPWHARRDLLSSGSGDRHFVVELESDGSASLRFGDDTHGTRPRPGTGFTATFRIGNGAAGNVAAESIRHVATTVAGIDRARNPLPAIGGTDPEAVERVRRFAPVAFRTQERAVTTDDYAAMAERHRQVQRAAASFRWTGSWRTVFVTADPFDGTPPGTGDGPFDPPLPVELEPFRMAGHDLDTSIPVYVPLEVEMAVCVKAGYFRSDVKRALLDVFSSRRLPDGRLGLFHADNLTLGQPVYLSPLIAAAYAVDGVESVAVTCFQRQGAADPRPLQDGRLTFGRLEIPRLANDRNFPERGVFRLSLEGGA